MLISESATLSLQKGGKILDICVSNCEVINKHCLYAIALCRELTETGACGAVSLIYRRWREFKQLEMTVVKLLKKRKAELGLDPKLLNIPSFEKPTVMTKSIKKSMQFMRSLDDYLKFVIRLPSEIYCHPDVNSFFTVRDDDIAKLIKRKPADELEGAFDISHPVSADHYIVRADFKNPGPNELEIHTGEEVEVVLRSDTGWWLAVSSKGSGWVPSSYLETSIQNYPFRPGCEEFHVVTKGYNKTLQDELSLPEGAIVQILDRNDSGWWSARFAGKVGLVPGTNLHRVNTMKAKRAINSLGKTPGKICPNMAALQATMKNSSSVSSFVTATLSSSTSSVSKMSLSSNNSSSMDSLSVPPSPKEGSGVQLRESVKNSRRTKRWSQESDGSGIVISNYELFQPMDSSAIEQESSQDEERLNERQKDRTRQPVPHYNYAFEHQEAVAPMDQTKKIVRMDTNNPDQQSFIWRTLPVGHV